jgi:LemA protein
MGTIFVSLLVLAPLVLGYVWYVVLISRRNKAQESLSGVDVQLKKRSNLIPNILKIAQRFMEHEKRLLTEITELRTRMDAPYDAADKAAVSEHLAVAEKISGKMGQLRVAMENYPDLKSDATMVQAMQTYNEVEAQIAAARRFYNASVTQLNNAVQIFPGSLLASLAGVAALPFYEVEESARAPVDVDDYLK